MVVLYEHDEGLVRLQELLRLPQVIILVVEIINSYCHPTNTTRLSGSQVVLIALTF